jgi:hypothetical protein
LDNFKYKVIKLTGINPVEVIKKIEREKSKLYEKLEKIASKHKKLRKKNKPIDHLDLADYVFDQVKI